MEMFVFVHIHNENVNQRYCLHICDICNLRYQLKKSYERIANVQFGQQCGSFSVC